MNSKRRDILKYAGATCLAATVKAAESSNPRVVHATYWSESLFTNRNLSEVLSTFSNGVTDFVTSRDIVLKAPDIVNVPTSVPVEVCSNIAGTTRIILIVEQNEYPMVADFKLFNGAHSISTRVKLQSDSYSRFNVRTIVFANGIAYSAVKSVHWTVNDN